MTVLEKTPATCQVSPERSPEIAETRLRSGDNRHLFNHEHLDRRERRLLGCILTQPLGKAFISRAVGQREELLRGGIPDIVGNRLSSSEARRGKDPAHRREGMSIGGGAFPVRGFPRRGQIMPDAAFK